MNPLLCLLFTILFSSVSFGADSVIEIDNNGKKISMPFWASQARQDQGTMLLIFGDAPKDTGGDLLPHLAIHFAKLGWSVALLNADSSNWTDGLPGAMTELRKKSAGRMIILHYGDQFKPLMDYLNQPQSKGISGLVLLSAFNVLSSTDKAEDDPGDDQQKNDLSRKKINFPMMDITAQFDYQVVLEQEKKRRIDNIKNPVYQRVRMPGTGHDYDYAHNLLVARIQGWMLHLQQPKLSRPPVGNRR